MGDEPKPAQELCTFQQHWAEMRDLARDVSELKIIYGDTASMVNSLNLSLQHIDRDLLQNLTNLNLNAEKWIDVGKALVRLGKIVVIGFVVVIIALVSQTLEVELNIAGFKVAPRKFGDTRDRPDYTVGASPTIPSAR